jgi:hypothetical protein
MTREVVARMKRNFDSDAKSHAAGIGVLDGTDTGQTRLLISYATTWTRKAWWRRA